MSEGCASVPAAVRWLDPPDRDLGADPIRFEVDGAAFACSFGADAVPGHLAVVKAPALVMAYVERLAPLRGGNVVELGVRHGGSTALLAALLAPRSLLAMELATDPLPLLDRHVDERGLADVVRVHLGVDQSDAATVGRLADETFDGPIDVVVDDASHLYLPTRSSFLTLFPRLRPGGLFVIEDWSASLVFGGSLPRGEAQRILDQRAREGAPPFIERLTLELVMAAGLFPDLIAGVLADRHWTVVTRGPATRDEAARALEPALEDRIGLLSARP